MHLYISGQVANFVQMANNSVSGGSTQRSQQFMTMHCVGLQRDEGAKTGQEGGGGGGGGVRLAKLMMLKMMVEIFLDL